MLINNNREWWWTWQWWDIYYKNTHYSRKGAYWCGSIDPTSCMWDLESDRKDPFVLFRDFVRSDVTTFLICLLFLPSQSFSLHDVWSISHKTATTNLVCSGGFSSIVSVCLALLSILLKMFQFNFIFSFFSLLYPLVLLVSWVKCPLKQQERQEGQLPLERAKYGWSNNHW